MVTFVPLAERGQVTAQDGTAGRGRFGARARHGRVDVSGNPHVRTSHAGLTERGATRLGGDAASRPAHRVRGGPGAAVNSDSD